MQSIEELQNLWNSDRPDAIELKNLLDRVVTHKSLRMEETDVVLFPILTANGIVFKDGLIIGGKSPYTIRTSDPFSFGLYTHFSVLEGYIPSFDLDALNAFIYGVGDRLLAPDTRHGIVHAVQGVLSIAIRMIAAKGELEKFCLSLKHTMPNMGLYSDVIFDLATTALIPISTKWTCIRHIAIEIGEGTSSNGHWITLGQVIEKYVSQNGEEGLALLAFAEKEIEVTPIRVLYAQILFGLNVAGKVTLENLTAMLGSTDKRDIAAGVLSRVAMNTGEEAVKILDAIDTVSDSQKAFSLQLPRLYISILRKAFVNPDGIYTRCLQSLDTMLAQGDKDVRNTTATMIVYCDGHDEALADILLKGVQANRPDDIEIKSLPHFFRLHLSVKPFFKCVKLVAAKLGLRFSESSLQESALQVRVKSAVDFDTELVNLLSTNEGHLRWAGHKILHEILHMNRGYRFANDLLLLNDIQQYKLIMSLLGYAIIQPDQIIPLIVPFFDAKNDIVKEFAISKIELLCNDYGQPVLDAVRLGLSNQPGKHADVCGRIEAYLADMRDARRAKASLKELDPYYNQGSLIRSYLSTHERLSRKTMTEGMKEHSTFSNMFDTVQVARGGGWKMGSMNDVQKLGELSVEMQIPRSMFIHPERNDLEFMQIFNENWKNLFK